jgi:hypothetical protein
VQTIQSLHPPKPLQDIEIRPDVIHLYGTAILSTQDIFDYLKEYSPKQVDWINDMSCKRMRCKWRTLLDTALLLGNVVFNDEYTAKRVLEAKSKKHSVHLPEIADSEQPQNSALEPKVRMWVTDQQSVLDDRQWRIAEPINVPLSAEGGENSEAGKGVIVLMMRYATIGKFAPLFAIPLFPSM